MDLTWAGMIYMYEPEDRRPGGKCLCIKASTSHRSVATCVILYFHYHSNNIGHM